MTNLVVLQEKVQMMLDGEKKRREIACKFLNELESILLDVAEDIWGTGDNAEFSGSVWVRTKKDNKNIATSIYFRFIEYEGERQDEDTGFYESDAFVGGYEYPLWGKDIKEMNGSDFWNAIRIIIEWVTILIETIDNRNESRDKLISLVNI